MPLLQLGEAGQKTGTCHQRRLVSEERVLLPWVQEIYRVFHGHKIARISYVDRTPGDKTQGGSNHRRLLLGTCGFDPMVGV